MPKYVVIKEFLDRFDNHRHLHPGDEHVPHSEERAQLLVSRGYIASVEVSEPTTEEKVEKPTRGRKTKRDGEANGEKTEGK